MARKAITFDFHNTLVHCDEWFELEVHHLPSAFARWHARSHAPSIPDESAAALDLAYRQLRREIIQHGNELTAEACLAAVFAEAGIQLDDETIARGVRELMLGALTSATAVPGAIDTVRYLADCGVPLGVVSSAVYHPFLEWALEKIGLLADFRVVVTSASSGFYKSRPEIYWAALNALDAAADASVHVGDSARFDVDGAARAGMRTVWLNHHSSACPETRPNLIVSSLQESAPRLLALLNTQAP